MISDTHDRHREMHPEDFPGGDLIIHAGDFSMGGTLRELASFLAWYDTLPYKRKVFIAGNHDWCFDKPEMRGDVNNLLVKYPGIDYLENSSIVIEGVKIYGSPITPWFHDWAFNRQRGADIRAEWEKIPKDTNILVTHGPPLNYGDKTVRGGLNVGCADLLDYVVEIKPVLHVFGHIHEGRGMYSTVDTTLVNASALDEYYIPVHNYIDIQYNDFINTYHEEKSERGEEEIPQESREGEG